MTGRWWILVTILIFPGLKAQPAEKISLTGVEVSGNITVSEKIICSTAGLTTGKNIYAADMTRAVKKLWATGLFQDVQINLDEETPQGISITINVIENLVLGSIQYSGNKKLKNDELDELLELNPGQRVKPNIVTAVTNKIINRYAEDGYLKADIKAELIDPLPLAPTEMTAGSLIRDLKITIEEGRKVKIGQIEFSGNNAFKSQRLRRTLKETKQQRWYLFWRSPYDQEKFEQDKLLLTAFYRNKGYRDFIIRSDSVYFDEKQNRINISMEVTEGLPYHYRGFSWEGNTIHSDDALQEALNLRAGDAYSEEHFNLAVYDRMQGLYMDQGYIYSQLTPQIIPVGEDSIDVHFLVSENHQVKVRNIRIVGNSKTRENVIRRELVLYPGDVFNRNYLMRSQRNIFMLNYFGDVQPEVYPVDENEVDLELSVVEKSSDQANMNIGFSGEYGVTGGGGFSFNNFDIGHPFVSGNGQQLALNITVGTSYTVSSSDPSEYQSYSLSYTDPRIFDTPNLVGGSLFHTFQGASTQYYYPLDIRVNGGSLRWGRRFNWPDDYFSGSWGFQLAVREYSGDSDYIDQYVGYFSEDDSTKTKSTGISLSQTIVRDGRDKQDFPSRGSYFSWASTLSGGPLGGNEDFHKQVLKMDWYTPVVEKLILMNSFKLGFIDHLSAGRDSISLIPLDEKFVLGGSGIPNGNMLRGYPDNSIGPEYSGSPIGGNVLMRWSSELRFLMSPDPIVYALAFAEAGNVWETKNFIEPFSVQRTATLNLKKSVGIGIRFNMPMVGMLGFDVGYGFDDIDSDGEPAGWNYHILFGQTF